MANNRKNLTKDTGKMTETGKKIQDFLQTNKKKQENAKHYLDTPIQELIYALKNHEDRRYATFKSQMFAEMVYECLIKGSSTLGVSELSLFLHDVKNSEMGNVIGGLSQALIRGFFSHGYNGGKYIVPVYKDLGDMLLHIDATRGVDMVVIDKDYFIKNHTNHIPVYLIDSKTSFGNGTKKLGVVQNNKDDQKLDSSDPLRKSLTPILGKIITGEAKQDSRLLDRLASLSEHQKTSNITLLYHPIKVKIVTGIDIDDYQTGNDVESSKRAFYNNLDQLRKKFQGKINLL